MGNKCTCIRLLGTPGTAAAILERYWENKEQLTEVV